MTRAVAPVRDRAAAPARIALRGLPRYDVDAICLPLYAFAPVTSTQDARRCGAGGSDSATLCATARGGGPERRADGAGIRNWVAQQERDAGERADGLSSDERGELRRLRRENKQLRIERDILKKAAAWFARESDSIPERGSSS